MSYKKVGHVLHRRMKDYYYSTPDSGSEQNVMAAPGSDFSFSLDYFEENPLEVNLDLSTWTIALLIVDLLLLAGVFLFVTYTYQTLYPTLAIIEDGNPPPAYSAVATRETLDQEGQPASEKQKLADERLAKNVTSGADDGDSDFAPVTSKFFRLARHLRSLGGWKALFRGIVCYYVGHTLHSLIIGFLAIFIGFGGAVPFAFLAASLATTTVRTAWVHIIMTPPSDRSFCQRLPNFRPTLRATGLPILLSWFLDHTISLLLTSVLELAVVEEPLPTPDNDSVMVDDSGEPVKVLASDYSSVALLAILLVSAVVRLAAFVFSQTILVRIQASLLPLDETPIVPFDRTFGGRIDPYTVANGDAVTHQRVRVADVLRSVTCATWTRLVKVFIQVGVFALGIAIAAAAFLGAQYWAYTAFTRN